VSQIEPLADEPESVRMAAPDLRGWERRPSFVAPVAQAISASGRRLIDARLGEPNLEDVFIHLTGRALR
jgi:hypothetical protein